jgi:thiol-disulfide isomerase/thioredoxin
MCIQSQSLADAVAPEDASFNKAYAKLIMPRVTGKLLNMSADELKNLTIAYSLVTPFSDIQVKKTVFAQPNGSFSLEIDYPFPYQQIWFGVGDFFYAGLYVNKDLYLELDMQKIKASKRVNYNGDGVRYLGSDGPLNVYLNNYVLYKRRERLELSKNISKLIFSRTATDDILPTYNKLFDTLKIIEDNYIAANPSPYSWILENERMSEYYNNISTYYTGKTMPDTIWQKVQQHKSYLMSNNGTLFYNYLTMYITFSPGNFSTSWKDLAQLPVLKPAEKLLIDSLRASEKKQPEYPYTTENIQKWTKQLQPQLVELAQIRLLDRSIKKIDSMFSAARADFLKLRLNRSKDVSEQKLEMERIMSSMHTAWCIDVLQKEYKYTTDKIDEINKILASSAGGTQHTSFGKPMIETSFGASLYNASDIKVVDFLAKLKQSFPNKAIIIDRWATWCAPCLSEMPHCKKLQEASNDLPAIFVYLCTISGSSENKWKSKVIELKQPGIHFLIDETLDAELSKYFSFSGYPGHAFIDKAGNYRPGAIRSMFNIKDREELAALINK